MATFVTVNSARNRARRLTWLAVAAVALLTIGLVGVWLIARSSGTSILDIRTTPSVGASVYIDGIPRGRTPIKVEGLEAGERLIALHAEGYKPITRSVKVEEDTVMVMELTLVASGSTGPPEGESPAAQADPNLDTGMAASEAEDGELPVGKDLAALEAEGEFDAEETPDEESNAKTDEEDDRESSKQRARRARRKRAAARKKKEEAEKKAAAAPAKTDYGVLVINTIPQSRIFIDGRDTGRNTPISSLKVRAGSHKIGFKTKDGKMYRASVTVKKNSTVKVLRRL